VITVKVVDKFCEICAQVGLMEEQSSDFRADLDLHLNPGIFYRMMRMYSADCAVARCLSVPLSHASILSKQLNIS